ncbi:MAG: C40 family peptidase [Sodalis sp. (in: enterobacteria)]|uniref:C40 family peptidase n=1 Tax=Sodalis sp. (in: enterobacteria) TaxID=1898979 RepID=UPI003F3D3289
MSESHKVHYQPAKLTAMAKLMSQVSKPYRWGGKLPTTDFDCSGLIYYAYKDLIRVPLPRTANEMYHLRDAAPLSLACAIAAYRSCLPPALHTDDPTMSSVCGNKKVRESSF